MNMSFRDDSTNIKCGTGCVFQLASTLYLLSVVNRNEVVLIALSGEANRYTDPMKVVDNTHLSRKEWDMVTAGDAQEFKFVGKIDELDFKFGK